MAELADALASGASPRKGVEVQVLLSAPTLSLKWNRPSLSRSSGFPLVTKPETTAADMAELADALASGASPRKGVEVQVLLSAPLRSDFSIRPLFFCPKYIAIKSPESVQFRTFLILKF